MLAYTASTIGVNAICSVAVCAHILYRSRSINTLLGQAAGLTYTGALAVIVECMVPYVLIGLIYLVMLGLQNPLSIVFLSLYSMFMVRASSQGFFPIPPELTYEPAVCSASPHRWLFSECSWAAR